MAVIDEAAVAVAAARCLSARAVARHAGDQWTTTHPRTCAWCAYPPDALSKLLDGWNAWAQPKQIGPATVYGRHEAQVFAELQRRDPAEAERRIAAAQGLEESPPGGTPMDEGTPAEPLASISPREPSEPVFSTVDEDVTAWVS